MVVGDGREVDDLVLADDGVVVHAEQGDIVRDVQLKPAAGVEDVRRVIVVPAEDRERLGHGRQLGGEPRAHLAPVVGRIACFVRPEPDRERCAAPDFVEAGDTEVVRVMVAHREKRRVTEVAFVEMGGGEASDLRIITRDARHLELGTVLDEVDERNAAAADAAREVHQRGRAV